MNQGRAAEKSATLLFIAKERFFVDCGLLLS